MDQKLIIISNVKLQIIFPNILFLDLMNINYTTFPVLTTNTMVFPMEIFLVDMGKVFQSGGIKIVLIKLSFNQINTQNLSIKIETISLHM